MYLLNSKDNNSLKKCLRCFELKSLDCFYYRKDRNTLYSLCKSCVNDKRREYKIKNPKTYQTISKKDRLKRFFNMTIDQYNQLFTQQNGCCAICNKHQSEFKTSLAVDHCHSTGIVRGLLCFKCNTGIGHFNDDLEILNNAIKYIKGNNNE